MASSDEEGEILPQYVTDYYFQTLVNEQKELVSFSALPLQWSEGEVEGDHDTQVFLVGTAEDELPSLHKRIVAWKFDISYDQPQIAVLTKDENWIELLDPSKCFENIIRTTLITVHCLHFVKRNTETCGELVWNHLQKVFSSYEVQPSDSDLLGQMQLIKKAAERDKDLEKSKYLISFMENSRKKEPMREVNERKEHCFKASDYYFQIFVNEQKELVSFSAMPLQWSEGEVQGDRDTQVFLVGMDGLQSLLERVITWKFEISDVQPEIAVLTENKNWIKLLDPRKCFENTIRTTLITVHCLHFLKRNPEAYGELIWNHLRNVFSSYEVQPSESDLLDQVQLIKKAIEMDTDLEKSKYLISLIEDPRQKDNEQKEHCSKALDYYFQIFVNEQKELVSFSAMPLQWSEGEVQGDCGTHVLLVGTAEDGLKSLIKQVVAWKFEITDVQPQIAVLTEDKNWIELLNPRKWFEDTIRTTLITVHCLHFVKRNPEACGELVWNHLQKVFSSYEVQPSESDLLDQMQLIKKVAERDSDLAKSEYLISFMENAREKEPIREVNEQKEHCSKALDYYFQIFVNEQKELVSFSAMPLQWSEGEVQGDCDTHVLLVGTAEDGLQSLIKQIVAWKFEITDVLPQIAVLTEDKNWTELLNPRKWFEDTIRATLITVHCLHFVKRNPEACGELVWNHLQKVFSSYEVQPSESDLLDQMELIKKVAERDRDLAKSEYLISFMENATEKEPIREVNEQKEHCSKALDYYFQSFVNEQKELVSFSAMPLQWRKGEVQGDCGTEVLLVGTAEDGLQSLIKQVVAWKFEITDVQPQISVLTEDKNWIELLNPRKWFEDTIRTTLITVHCLHFVKRNPEARGELVWNHLQKVFSSYEVQPSQSDLLDQMELIKIVAERDSDLAKSEYLISFMDNAREKEPIREVNEQKEHCSKALDYYFQSYVNEQKELVSFSAMPLQWRKGEVQGDCGTEVLLVGKTEDGLQSLREQVVAWKFDISYVQPQIAVLTKEKNWIELLNPRKWTEDTIRTTLITVHCLHFMKWNPEASGELIWNHLQKTFSSYEVQPSESDLQDQMQLIKKAVEMDRDLEKSKYLISFMKNLRKKEPIGEDIQTTKKPDFINDDYKDKDDATDDEDIDAGDDDEEESNIFDTVCAICDNGGEVLGCQGSCMRSFHASKDAGVDSSCETLGYSRAEVETMPNFLCKNCLHNQHQCFACGLLGSSDISSSAEVFPCIAGGCGRFYHPECVAKLLRSEKDTEAELRAKIGAGEAFTCPSHKCFSCKEFENKNVCELQLAMCRRCPKSYHRKCLPKAISFEYSVECFPRAWDGLLPNNRILIYCLKHPIVVELGTPERNHLVFPEAKRRKRKYCSGLKLSRERVATETSMVPKDFVSKPFGMPGSGNEVCKSTKKVEKGFHGQDLNPLKKLKILDMTRKSLKDKSKLIPEKVSRFVATDDSKVSLRKSSSSFNTGSHPVKSKHQNTVSGKNKSPISVKPMLGITNSSRPSIHSKMQKRILSLMKDSTASFDVEAFKKRYGVQSNYTSSTSVLDKTLTEGKLEMSAKAVRAALQKIEGGGSIEDAKALCEPDLLRQMFKWKRKLNVYLTPFLYGKRYTSFGRHFTKLDKLKEIVDRLHWYVKDGDMIVDFCCGSNDFSCLMKEKLDKMGKRCLFKNYDLIQAKNDFSFEKRDWMSVNGEELPIGSRLIMGLNPPFGVQAALANRFIDKALQFKPKLLILIVPKETRRLDMKAPRYDLIWEDERLLSGKSFYLPGSVDVHDKQLEDWNLRPPPLYLWSRPDWTVEHKAIAEQRSHISKEQALHMENHTWIRQIHHEAEQGGTQTRFPGGWREAGIATETPLNENDQPLERSCYSQNFALPPPPLNENYQPLEESCYSQNFGLPPPPPLNVKTYFQTASLHYCGFTNLPSPTPPSPPPENYPSLPLPPPPPLETYPFLPLPPPPPLENYPFPAPPSCPPESPPPPPPPPPESYPSPPPSPPSSPSPNTSPSPIPSTPSPSTRIVYSLNHPDAGGWASP